MDIKLTMIVMLLWLKPFHMNLNIYGLSDKAIYEYMWINAYIFVKYK